MKILITLSTPNALVASEMLSLAFVLSSFEHTIQLHLEPSLLDLFAANPRLIAMLTAAPLYDLPPTWCDQPQLFVQKDARLDKILCQTPHYHLDDFHSILVG